MSNPDEFFQFPATAYFTPRPLGAPLDSLPQFPVTGTDLRVPLLNLSTLRARMESLQRFLSDSVNSNTLIGEDQMEIVSTEIAAAIHQVIVNGAALVACSQTSNLSSQSEQIALKPPEIPKPIALTSSNINLSESDPKLNFDNANIKIPTSDLKVETVDEQISDEWDIIELDAVELLAEHVHFCDICGKGFKRDANLRMHMRAHGNQYKTPEALAKPERNTELTSRITRFSCPFDGCNRNKLHKKFRPLKSVICVKNHFKRSHCPKMFSCNRCNNKSFSVVADLKSHLKHCGEAKWKCSCGTSFSRKDKLFGHMALFEGHMPAVVEDNEKAKGATATVVVEDEEDGDRVVKEMELGENSTDNGLFEGLLEGFDSIENFCLQDVLGSVNGGLGNGMDWIL